MLKIGIIGCGKISELRHAPEYTDNPDVQIVGFYDFFPERAKALADKFGGRVYESVEEMLKDVDAVSVCTANNNHAESTIMALDAGKHVLCEKPMAISLEECEAMVEAAERNRKLLMIGHNQRFSKAHVEAKRLIREGKIGKVLMFHTRFGHSGPEVWTGTGNTWFFDKKRAVLGALADLGIHKTDLIHFLLEDPIVKVSANIHALDKTYPDGTPISVEDNAMCLYETRSGVMGTMHVSWTLYNAKEDNSTVIYGTEGVMKLYADPKCPLIVEKKDGTVVRYKDMEEILTNEEQKAGKLKSTGVINAFVDAIENGKRTPATGAEALKAMRVIFAAEEAARTGKTVEVKH